MAGQSRRGVAATAGSQIFRLSTQFLSIIILSRQLTPDDFGLVGMVLAITALADQLTDMGLSQAVVQRRTITQAQVSALFWINTAGGIGFALLLAALSPLIAIFYNRDELIGITLVVAPSYFLAGVIVQHQALLQRQLKFGSIASRDVAGRTLSIVVAIGLAAAGAGYWALAAMPLAGAVARTVLVWTACDWRPSRPGPAEGLRSMLKFGGNITGSGLLGYASRNADKVLIGRFNGAGALGLYSRAFALLLLPLGQVNQPIAVVAIPTLSRLTHQPARYREYFRTALFTVSLLALPLVVLLGLVADVLIVGLMGDNWADAVPIFQVLAIAGFAQAISGTAVWLWVSQGRADRMFHVSLITRPLTVLACVLGLLGGPVGVAWALAISSVVLAVPTMWSATRDTPVRLSDIADGILRPMVATVPLAAAVLTVRAFVTVSPLVDLVAAAGAGTTVYAVVVFAWPSCRQQVRRLLGRGGGNGNTRPTAAAVVREPAPGHDPVDAHDLSEVTIRIRRPTGNPDPSSRTGSGPEIAGQRRPPTRGGRHRRG